MANDEKTLWEVPVVWENWGVCQVEAETMDEAIQKAIGPDTSLPEGHYVDDSIRVDEIGVVERLTE